MKTVSQNAWPKNWTVSNDYMSIYTDVKSLPLKSEKPRKWRYMVSWNHLAGFRFYGGHIRSMAELFIYHQMVFHGLMCTWKQFQLQVAFSMYLLPTRWIKLLLPQLAIHVSYMVATLRINSWGMLASAECQFQAKVEKVMLSSPVREKAYLRETYIYITYSDTLGSSQGIGFISVLLLYIQMSYHGAHLFRKPRIQQEKPCILHNLQTPQKGTFHLKIKTE